jgi:hypothetical protein
MPASDFNEQTRWSFAALGELYAKAKRTCETAGVLTICLPSTMAEFCNLETGLMLKVLSITVTAAAAVMLVTAGPTLAKKKPKKAEEATPQIIAQPKCTGMKTMHWDDATQTCQKNKK